MIVRINVFFSLFNISLSKPKGKEANSKIETLTQDTLSKPNEQLFLFQMAMQLHYLKTAVTSILPIFHLKKTKQNKTESIMVSCFTADHTAGDQIHTDIIIDNNRNTALERSVKDYCEKGEMVGLISSHLLDYLEGGPLYATPAAPPSTG